MPPRSFSVYQPVHSHSFADFGLSGGVEGLRWSKQSPAAADKMADTVIERLQSPTGFCSISQIRTSTFPDQSFAPPSKADAQSFLSSARKRISPDGSAVDRDAVFDFASVSRSEILSMASDSARDCSAQLRAACNNSSSLALLHVSGVPHLLWTTGSNCQFLMCSAMHIDRAVADPASSLNACVPALDCSSLPAAECVTRQRISDVEVRLRCACASCNLTRRLRCADCRCWSISKHLCQVPFSPAVQSPIRFIPITHRQAPHQAPILQHNDGGAAVA
jgi:hypothetical protein